MALTNQKLFLSFIFFCLLPIAGMAQEKPKLVSLEKLAKKYENTADLTYQIIIYQRCAALYATVASVSLKTNEPMQSTYFDLTQTALTYALAFSLQQSLERGGKPDVGMVNAQVNQNFSALADQYIDWFNVNWLQNGNYFEDDEELASELPICQSALEAPPKLDEKLLKKLQ